VAVWLEEYENDHRASSVAQARVSMNKYLIPKLRGRPLPHIGKAELQKAIDAVPAKQKASRQQVFAYASIFFRWASDHSHIAESPVPNMAKPKAPKARDRVLSPDELASIWQATTALREPLGAFYRLLLLTGQRREEVASMSWADLDRASATWIIPADRAKNGLAHIVPLTPPVIEEIDRLALARQVKDRINDVDATRWRKSGPVVSIKGTAPLSCFSQAKKALDAEATKARKEEGPCPPGASTICAVPSPRACRSWACASR
jgi:integrase